MRTLGRLLTFLVSLTFVFLDIRLVDAFSPYPNSPHIFYAPGLALFFVSALALCEYHLLLGRRLNYPEELRRFRVYAISQFEFHNPYFSIYYLLIQTYLWVLGIHFFALVIRVFTLAGLLDPLIILHTSTAIGVGIIFHALTVGMRYGISRKRDHQFPREIAPYTIGDDGEIEYSMADDSEGYYLNIDGEVEEVEHT